MREIKDLERSVDESATQGTAALRPETAETSGQGGLEISQAELNRMAELQRPVAITRMEFDALAKKVARVEQIINKNYCWKCERPSFAGNIAHCTKPGCPYDRSEAQAILNGKRR